MVPWVVINRQQPRQSPRFLRSGTHSHFGSHPSAISETIPPFFSCTYVETILQPLCFQIHACNGGVYPPPRHSYVHTCRSSDASDLSPFFSIPCALIHTTAASQPLSYLSLPHSFHHDGGCTPLPSSPERIHPACSDPVGALRGKGVTVSLENCRENVTAPASGVKKDVGQTFLSVPQISVSFVLRGESVLGQQMRGDFAQVPNDAEPGQNLQRVISDVDLPPVEALARRGHEVMMVVVPAFAERQQCEQPVVLAGVTGFIAARTEEVRERIDGEGV